jgi:hypothetical protein
MSDVHFDSGFERKLYAILDPTEANYHPIDCKLYYTVTSGYEPDFVVWNDDGTTTYVEAKGRFRDATEARKYRAVRDSLKPTEELVFIFQNPNVAMPNTSKRRDGTKYSISEWADRYNFTWYTAETLPDHWRRKL